MNIKRWVLQWNSLLESDSYVIICTVLCNKVFNWQNYFSRNSCLYKECCNILLKVFLSQNYSVSQECTETSMICLINTLCLNMNCQFKRRPSLSIALREWERPKYNTTEFGTKVNSRKKLDETKEVCKCFKCFVDFRKVFDSIDYTIIRQLLPCLSNLEWPEIAKVAKEH